MVNNAKIGKQKRGEGEKVVGGENYSGNFLATD